MKHPKVGKVFLLSLSLLMLLIIGCEKTEMHLSQVDTSEEVYSEEVIPIEIDVIVKNGALVFKSFESFVAAANLLDTVNLSSRIAWEKSIGFKSLRRVREEAINKMMTGDSQFHPLIDYSTTIPVLKDYTTNVSSVLNEEGILYINEAIGSFKRDGSYWAMDGNKSKLFQAIETQKSNKEEQIYAIVNHRFVESRTCSFGSTVISPPSAVNGNKRADGIFEYNDLRMVNPLNGLAQVNISVRMEGRSYKRNCGSCSWKNDRSDHTFSWDIEITGETSSDPHIFDNGSDVHIDNQFAAINLFDLVSIDDGPLTLLTNPTASFNLETTNFSFHTTAEVTPIFNSFACS